MSDQSNNLGQLLRAERLRGELTLRAVEEATGVSNAYLSQLESGKIRQPSPTVLHKLCELYKVSYATVMELAGYPVPHPGKDRASTIVDSRLGPLTSHEEDELRDYLKFLRTRRSKREDL